MNETTADESVPIQAYDPAWPTAFLALSARAKEALGNLAITLEHVGSTAVPGLVAKPIIDLDVVVASRADIAEVIRLLATIGYLHEGDLGIAGREAFQSPAVEPAHHLYVVEEGAKELHRHLAFRDALRADNDLRDRYAVLKEILAKSHANERKAYTDGKTAFITAVLKGI
jgi:GrpB-like predicted nucleotidyltransferase (UPF0157 family)